MDTQGLSEDNWRYLDNVWYQVQSDWRGITADSFALQFWSQFEQHIHDYHVALAELTNAIDEALRVADYSE